MKKFSMLFAFLLIANLSSVFAQTTSPSSIAGLMQEFTKVASEVKDQKFCFISHTVGVDAYRFIITCDGQILRNKQVDIDPADENAWRNGAITAVETGSVGLFLKKGFKVISCHYSGSPCVLARD
ncbi:MAG: hypothetical protein WCG27_11790 [Pseudomonadota bacterium]